MSLLYTGFHGVCVMSGVRVYVWWVVCVFKCVLCTVVLSVLYEAFQNPVRCIFMCWHHNHCSVFLSAKKFNRATTIFRVYFVIHLLYVCIVHKCQIQTHLIPSPQVMSVYVWGSPTGSLILCNTVFSLVQSSHPLAVWLWVPHSRIQYIWWIQYGDCTVIIRLYTMSCMS